MHATGNTKSQWIRFFLFQSHYQQFNPTLCKPIPLFLVYIYHPTITLLVYTPSTTTKHHSNQLHLHHLLFLDFVFPLNLLGVVCTLNLTSEHESQWEMARVGFSVVEQYWVNWCPINPMNSTQFHLKNENGLKISRAKLSGIPSPQVQWCQEQYFWIYSNWLYQTRFNDLAILVM